jgi:pimeloyl-ACP methyl ester carboxylesterase
MKALIQPEDTLVSRRAVRIPAGPMVLSGDLVVPKDATGLVIFAHGSGSSRKSQRNQFVAAELVKVGLATLLFDLLTEEEEEADQVTHELRFDLDLLATRLVDATLWAAAQPLTRDLQPGYFGASTGGGAALMAAAQLMKRIGAVVSRGGRPDLAGNALAKVKAPTLLLVGELDDVVLRLNEDAFENLRCVKDLQVVPGASHLFEEPNKLQQVAQLAAAWFKKYLKS